MGAILDKTNGFPFMFSIESPTEISILDTISIDKIDKMEIIKEDMKLVRELLSSALKKMNKKFPNDEEKCFKIKHFMIIELLSDIFQECFDNNTSPIESVDYILSLMDEVWKKIQEK